MLLLEKMKGVEDREAYFTCALCLYLSPTRIYVIQEEAKGKISLEPSLGKEGFGYDPVFFSDEAGKIVADLEKGEKGKYSHRGKAARVMMELLKKEYDFDENANDLSPKEKKALGVAGVAFLIFVIVLVLMSVPLVGGRALLADETGSIPSAGPKIVSGRVRP